MCGRFTLTNPGQLSMRFDVPSGSGLETSPRYNIAPTQLILAIVDGPHGRRLQQLRWGFRPSWAREETAHPAPINARAETLTERPLFRGALARGRCLIPADGLYEWQHVADQKTKQPMYIHLRGGTLFAFAGLYTQTRDDTGQAVGTCAIVTCGPNEVMASVHTRMPVILHPDDEAAWLDSEGTEPVQALSLLRPYPAREMEAMTVSTRVNDARRDDATLIMPLMAA